MFESVILDVFQRFFLSFCKISAQLEFAELCLFIDFNVVVVYFIFLVANIVCVAVELRYIVTLRKSRCLKRESIKCIAAVAANQLNMLSLRRCYCCLQTLTLAIGDRHNLYIA